MVQIIEEQPGIGARFAQGIGRGLSGESQNNLVQQFSQMMQQKQMEQKQAKDLAQADKMLEQNYGIKLSGIKDPKIRESIISESLRGKNKKEIEGLKYNKKTKEDEEKSLSLEQGFDTLNRMREIRKKGNLGRLSGTIGKLHAETRKDRGEYEQLGKSLIQLSTNIPIRNKLEFETLAEKLYDPDITDSEAQGVLNAMERLLKGQSKNKEKIKNSNNSTLEDEMKRRGLI